MFDVFHVPQYCPCMPVPLKLRPLFPCFPETNILDVVHMVRRSLLINVKRHSFTRMTASLILSCLNAHVLIHVSDK